MLGEKLGSFTLESKLGSGAMGQVYLAVHDKKGLKAAVKVMTADASGKGSMGERFEREAEILQQFRHPNIVRFYAVGRSKGRPYIAMEYVDGGTLDERLEREGVFDWPEVVKIGIQVSEALHYAHSHGVIHRDLKPSNLMITSDGTIKLTDFGIAKDLDATALTATGRTLGTAAYMAPEQIRGTPAVSHKTDLYALGCVLFQLLTGRLPFEGTSAVSLMHKHLSEEPPRPSSRNPQIPKALDNLVVSLLAKAPADRPWDAAAVSHKLSEIQKKLESGQGVAMVFGGKQGEVAGDSIPLAATQVATGGAGISGGSEWLGSGTGTRASTKSTSKKRKKQEEEEEQRFWSWGTALLGAALLVVGGLIVWQLLPPSAEKLYEEAGKLMSSDKPGDWKKAERELFTELDRRYPGHKYEKELSAWRDKIAYETARRRAEVMERSAVPSLREPTGEVEALFVKTLAAAQSAVETRYESRAARMWQEMADQVKQTGATSDRGWALLAERRAAEMREVVGRRRAEALDLLTRADAEELAGKAPELVTRLRQSVVERYAEYPDLSDLVARARAGLAAAGEGIPRPEDGHEAGEGSGVEAGETKAGSDARRETSEK
jgi:serine/threonine-protein kinase